MSAHTCPICGAGIDPDSRFCGACGRTLDGKPVAAPRIAQKTVLGLPLSERPADADPPISAPDKASDKPPRAPVPARDLSARTMLGVPSPVPPTRLPTEQQAPPAAKPEAEAARTILGMQLDVTQLEEAAQKRKVESPASKASDEPAQPRTPPEEHRSRAMVHGLSTPRTGDPISSTPPEPRSHSDSSYEDSSLYDRPSSIVPGRRRGAPTALLVGLMVLAIAALATAAVIGYHVLSGNRSDRLAVSVSRSPAGDAALLDLVLTPFTPGTQIELLDQRRPVEAGRVRFEIPMAALAVGPNDLPAIVVEPSGTSAERVRLVLGYRVRPDLAGLQASPPSYALVFEAQPGASVEVEGRPLLPDAQGRLAHTVLLSATLETGPMHTVRFRVTSPGGPPEEGQVTTPLPITALSVDRPGNGVVVEADGIDVAGATEPGATVTINGAIAPLTGDRFLQRVPLLSPSELVIEIVARAVGKVPHPERRTVRRVESLRSEIASFVGTVDRTLTYPRISENPSIYRGQRATFFGKVFNLRTEAGTTILQILVRDCPEGLRCSLWAEYVGETSAQMGDWVEVHGTLDGEQSYRTARGEQLSVPKVRAQFVIRRNAP